MRHLISIALLAVTGLAPAAHAAPAAAPAAIAAAIADPARPPADRARDRYRHPAQTLAFFGVRPGQTVVEFSPGGGWYTQILAPLLRDGGHYVALTGSSPKATDAATKMLAAGGARFGAPTLATLDPATGATTIPEGSADVVLTFRNVHNLTMDGKGADTRAFAAFFRALKPGGVLGVVDHHLPEARPSALEASSGYVKRSTVIRLARAAGFRLAGESAINANPRDTHDWPKGVWTLPPTLDLGETDKAKYLAIGESDRMTLKFVKP